MFAAAARREWDCLLFWSLDRFSREGAFPTLRYLTRLSELGVSYRWYTEEYINSTGIFGDVIISLLATLARQETIRLSERTIAGFERARAQGRVGGVRDCPVTETKFSGWLRLPIGALPQRAIRNGLMGAFGAGFLLSLALTPCGTPVLASVLSYVAYKASVVYGAILLLFCGVGSGLPLVLVGTTAGKLTAKLERAGYGLWTERVSGTALLILGLFLVWRA